jgi:hypothetical protein
LPGLVYGLVPSVFAYGFGHYVYVFFGCVVGYAFAGAEDVSAAVLAGQYGLAGLFLHITGRSFAQGSDGV